MSKKNAESESTLKISQLRDARSEDELNKLYLSSSVVLKPKTPMYIITIDAIVDSALTILRIIFAFDNPISVATVSIPMGINNI